MNHKIIRRSSWALSLITGLLVLFLSIGFALAAGEQLPRSLVSSGGGLIEQSGLKLQSAVGQPAVGAVANNYTLCSGLICGAGAPPATGGGEEDDQGIYLPFLLKN